MEEETYLKEIEKNKGIIIKVVHLYADDPEDRKDLYQEIIYQSWKSYGNFKGESKFSTWLYKVSLNIALTFLTKKKKLSSLRDELPLPDNNSDSVNSDRTDYLYRAITQLAEIDRAVIMLHLDGYANDEISEMMGISKNHTGVKLHRIRQQLTTLLNNK